MQLLVLTPEKEVYSGQIVSVRVPGASGQFEILKGHSPIVSSLTKGVVKIKDVSGQIKELEVLKGFVEVLRDEVSLLVQVASLN